MKNEELTDQIKSRGHWRIVMHSVGNIQKRFPTRGKMEDLLSKVTVSLRGLPIPNYPSEESAYNGNYLEGQSETFYRKEYWRLYESGQWVHYLSLPGAWIPREELFKLQSPLPDLHAGYIHVRGDVLFTLTEIFHFAIGLAQGGAFGDDVALSIELLNTRDYMLVEDFSRPWFLFHKYVNDSVDPIIQERHVPIRELSAFANQLAVEMSIRIFEVFGWVPTDPAVRLMGEDQKKLIDRKPLDI